MKSAEYWQERSEQVLLEAERNTAPYLNHINAIYSQTAADIQKDMERIFRTYQQGFTREEAEAWLREEIPMEEYNRLKALLPSIQDEKYKAELTMRLNAQSYRFRIGREEYLRQTILSRLSVAADREKAISAGCYRNTLRESYNRTMFDIQKGVGVGFSFNQIPEKAVEKLLSAQWYGQNFSASVWQNRESVATAAGNVLKEGVLAGHSIERMAKALKEQTYAHSMSNAARLIRTEVNYFSNQGAKMSYEEAELDEYDFLATLDGDTSDVCREHDGKRFPLNKAEAGENYPPLHPWCRSTVAPVINVPGVQRMQIRRARDPETGKSIIVDDMNYTQWKAKFVDIHSKAAPTIRDLKGSGKQVLQGKSSGKITDFKGDSSAPELIGTVDFSDKDAVLEQLARAEQETVDLDYEVNCSVTADGKVWRVSGRQSTVDPSVIPSDLKGSYSYHNHPTEKTNYSFSAEDVAFFMKSGEAFSKASDNAYEYVMRRKPETIEKSADEVYNRFKEIEKTDVFEMKWAGTIDPDQDGYHETMKMLSRELNFEYERKKKNR